MSNVSAVQEAQNAQHAAEDNAKHQIAECKRNANKLIRETESKASNAVRNAEKSVAVAQTHQLIAWVALLFTLLCCLVMNATFITDARDFFTVPVLWCAGKAKIYFNWLEMPYYMDGLPGYEQAVYFTSGMAWFFRILTIALLTAGNFGLIFGLIKLWKYYQKRWCNLSLKVLIATLIIILVFGGVIRQHVPINLVLIFLVVQIIYLGVLKYFDDFFANRNRSREWENIQNA